jgi:hypothetical protein
VSRYFFRLDVQADGVTNFINQLDAIHTTCAARGAAYFVQQLEQYARVHIRCDTDTRVNAKMQDRKPLMCGADEHGNPHGSALGGNCEQRLHAVDVSDAHAQASVLFINFGYAIGVYGLLNTDSDAMLVYVEKQKLLQGGALFGSQSRCDSN